jgi:hypothetical protein
MIPGGQVRQLNQGDADFSAGELVILEYQVKPSERYTPRASCHYREALAPQESRMINFVGKTEETLVFSSRLV